MMFFYLFFFFYAEFDWDSVCILLIEDEPAVGTFPSYGNWQPYCFFSYFSRAQRVLTYNICAPNTILSKY